MRIQDDLEMMRLPKQYMRNGKDCFLDPYRKRLIEITPEEIIRQRTAKYFETMLKVPAAYIMLEMPMSKYLAGARGRADIVIHQKAPDNTLVPLLVVECKQPEVFLTDQVAEQAAGYCDITGADYFVITNGIDMEIYKYAEEFDRYIKLENLPSYEEMVSEKGDMVPEKEKLSRFTWEELHDIELMRDYSESDVWIFGGDTPKKFIPFAVNLYQALLDEEHRLPMAEFRTFEMCEDLGIRYCDYSNGGGGHFNGLFRSFLVKDIQGDSQMLSFSVFGTGTDTKYDQYEKRKSYTSFMAAIDRFKVSKAVLEYNMDAFLELYETKAVFRHNGRISSLPSDKLREYVAKNAELIMPDGDLLDIGWLPNNRLLFLDGEEESRFMYAVMEYTLLRDKFRSVMRK